MGQALLGLDQLAAIVAGVTGKSGEASLHLIDARLDHVGRVSDAFGLAVDHADQLADFLHRVADLREAVLGLAAALDAGLDLGRDGAGFAGQLANGRSDLAGGRTRVMGKFLHLGSDDSEAAAGIAGAGGLDGRIQRQHVGLAGDGFNGRGDHLDLVHGRGETGHALTKLDDQLGQPLEAGNGLLDGVAAGIQLGLGLLGQQAGFVRGIRDPGLVGQQAGRDLLEAVQRLQMLANTGRHVLDVAGNVAALDRQGTAVSRHRADRVFGNFLNAGRRHVHSSPPVIAVGVAMKLSPAG
jgi:hypothetical protein